jgi:lipoate-protein ligase B
MNLTVRELGLLDYEVGWQLQRELVQARRAEKIGDTLLLLEHPHTYTIGRKGTAEHLLASPERLKALGAQALETDRGGDITYHGPGQLVGYPLLDLRLRQNDVHRYLRNLEESIIRTLVSYNMVARREPKYTGVWLDVATGSDKIAAIGVKVSVGVTLHGFALNVNTQLAYFEEIIPCGISDTDKGVTSLQKVLGVEVDMREVQQRLIENFAEVFGYSTVTRFHS